MVVGRYSGPFCTRNGVLSAEWATGGREASPKFPHSLCQTLTTAPSNQGLLWNEKVFVLFVACLFTYPAQNLFRVSMGMDAQLSAAIAGYWAKVKPHNPEEELVVTATPTQTAVRLEPITQRRTPSCQSRSA